MEGNGTLLDNYWAAQAAAFDKANPGDTSASISSRPALQHQGRNWSGRQQPSCDLHLAGAVVGIQTFIDVKGSATFRRRRSDGCRQSFLEKRPWLPASAP